MTGEARFAAARSPRGPIKRPGVYAMDDARYFADPVLGGSLTSTGARLILECPALYVHSLTAGETSTRAFDHGKAAHARVLGAGADLVVVDAPDWRTKAAQAARDQARADGKTPILTADSHRVDAMAAVLAEHPVAARLLDPTRGNPERVLVWRDPDTDMMLRAKLDWLPDAVLGRRMVLPDYKTAETADPAAFARSAAAYGYHIQAAFYTAAVEVLGLADDVAFVFIIQAKTPPYLVTVAQLDDDALRIGRNLMRRAVATYADCKRSGEWPAYTDDVALVALPAWYRRAHETEITYD